MLQVNHERVAKLLQGLASFTDSEEGVTRLAYSPLDKKAQSWLLEQVQDLHLQIRTDAVGNVFLRRDGKQQLLFIDRVFQFGQLCHFILAALQPASGTLYGLCDIISFC